MKWDLCQLNLTPDSLFKQNHHLYLLKKQLTYDVPETYIQNTDIGA